MNLEETIREYKYRYVHEGEDKADRWLDGLDSAVIGSMVKILIKECVSHGVEKDPWTLLRHFRHDVKNVNDKIAVDNLFSSLPACPYCGNIRILYDKMTDAILVGEPGTPQERIDVNLVVKYCPECKAQFLGEGANREYEKASTKAIDGRINKLNQELREAEKKAI